MLGAFAAILALVVLAVLIAFIIHRSRRASRKLD